MKAFFQVDDQLTNPFFVATVEDNNDPTFNYRVRVRIPHIHPDILSTEQLPWAAKLCNSFMGIGDGQDIMHSIPEVGSQVLVLAIGNNLNSLIYLGSLYKKTAQTPTGAGYLSNYGIYRSDGQFIGMDKVQKLFQMLIDGDIEIDKVHNIRINITDDATITCNNATLNVVNQFTVTAPTSVFNGNIIAKGEVSAKSGTVNLTTHVHEYTPGSGTPTDTAPGIG